jgi:glycerophosphoryl diester phosphodiesterase
MRLTLPAVLLAAAALLAPASASAAPDQARLLGRAVLPAATFAGGPASGTLLAGQDTHGVTTPFPGQPVQGFSAALPAGGGRSWVLADNGYGSIENSSDFELRLYLVKPDYRTGAGGSGGVTVQRWITFRDPDHKAGFPIVNEFTGDRVLTGSDFDPESIQRAADGTFWVGEEFGPFLLHFDADGTLLDAPLPLPDADHPGKEIRSPQSPRSEETAALRVMNALRADARAHGDATPVVSPDANLIADGDPATGEPTRQAPPAGSGLPAASSELFDLKSLHAAGFKVVPYTVNDPERMRTLIRLGVDGLISDRPDLLRQIMAEEHVDPAKFDAEGHRGGRNLRPENTLPAMEAGLDQLVSTLETDNGVTKDGVPVLSHDPYVETRKCRHRDGTPYGAGDQVLIKDVTFADLQGKYVCDGVIRTGTPQSNDRALSPVAVAFAAHEGLADPYVMPSTRQLFDFVAFYAAWFKSGPGKNDPGATERWRNAERVRFNIETKVNPRSDRDELGNRYDQRTIAPLPLTRAVAGAIATAGMQDRADVQSFDLSTLRIVHREFSDIPTVALFGDFPRFADPSIAGSDDGTNLQPQGTEANTRWLAGMSWPYRSTAQDTPFRAQASGGFEGMAITPDGRTLVPLLEKPLLGEPGVLRAYAFDVEAQAYTGDRWTYPLDPRGVSVADFQLLDRRHGLVIERDGTQADLGGFKALEEVRLGRPGSVIAKRPAADLLRIADPHGISGPGAPGDVGLGNPFAMPFTTIEALEILDRRRVVVLNDNNFPFSVGRHVGSGAPDDDEFVVVRLPRRIAR